VDNGTRGTVGHVDLTHRVLAVTADDGRRLSVPGRYLDAGLVEYAYCLTGHGMQGATVEAAGIVSRPDDHSQHWSYTASSRARGTTRHLVVQEADGEALDSHDTMRRLADAIVRDDGERLALDQLPDEASAPSRDLGRGTRASPLPPLEPDQAALRAGVER
jgi:ATP-dependent exoDNAse (exonuclease V) alpha subunit